MKSTLSIWLMAFASLAFGVDVSPLSTSKATIDVLTNQAGMTLYVFDNDKNWISACEGMCETFWPPLLLLGDLPSNPLFGFIVRGDGSPQLTFRGRPLYTHSKDLQP